MWRRKPSDNKIPLILVALLPLCGCSPRSAQPEVVGVTEEWVTYSPVDQRKTVPPPDQSPSAQRVRELEQQLAERDRQIAAVNNEIQTARGQGAAPAAAAPASVASAAQGQPPPAQAAPAPPPAPHAETVEPQQAAAQPARARAADTKPAPAPGQVEAAGSSGPSADADDATDTPPPMGNAKNAAPTDATRNGAPDPRLAAAQKRIVTLERQLVMEVKRRQEVESEMTRLLAETSAGPYEQAQNVVEKHLREELGRARKEITQLRTTLVSERRERDDLERRFAALQAQVETAAKAAPQGGVSNEEVEALKERQRRVLASIQQDLAASRQHEAELRQALEASQGPNGVSVADDVSNLRAENSALQLRLDQEHQRNRDLATKLQLATRVTDLIYKMQSSGTESVAAVPIPH